MKLHTATSPLVATDTAATTNTVLSNEEMTASLQNQSIWRALHSI